MTAGKESLFPRPRPQGDATLCRCGRTEYFPPNCPCQKQGPKK